MTESAYQKARKLLNAGTGWTAGTCAAVLAALETGEKAEANYQWMVEHAADNKLDGYRELASKCAELEERAEKAEARLRETAQILMAEVGATGPQNVEEAAARIVARVRELEMIFRPEALGPVPEPSQSTDVAELDMPREPVTTPAEPGPASVAEQEPAAEVSADGSGVTGEHCP
jgi:hypothetical protein